MITAAAAAAVNARDEAPSIRIHVMGIDTPEASDLVVAALFVAWFPQAMKPVVKV